MSFEGTPLPSSLGAAENSWRQLHSGEGGSRQPELSREVCVCVCDFLSHSRTKGSRGSHLSLDESGDRRLWKI